MATLSHAQLVTLWEVEGGDPLAADTAAAIAQAESGGCQYAKAGPTDDRPVKTCTYRRTTRENSYGLWQINRRAHPQYTSTSLYTTVGNAKAAIAISGNGADFSPWSTYKDGSYKQYLQTIQGPFPGPSAGGPLPPDAATSHMHHGWADLRQSVTHHLPNQLRKSDTATRAAYRVLAGKSRRRG